MKNSIKTRISNSWNNQREATKLAIIFAGNVALGLAMMQLITN